MMEALGQSSGGYTCNKTSMECLFEACLKAVGQQ